MIHLKHLAMIPQILILTPSFSSGRRKVVTINSSREKQDEKRYPSKVPPISHEVPFISIFSWYPDEIHMKSKWYPLMISHSCGKRPIDAINDDLHLKQRWFSVQSSEATSSQPPPRGSDSSPWVSLWLVASKTSEPPKIAVRSPRLRLQKCPLNVWYHPF